MPQLKDVTCVKTDYVSLSLGPKGDISKEEAYFTYTMTWLGKSITADLVADRYQTADGRLTDWRVAVQRGADSAAVMAQIRSVIFPQVLDWVVSSDYRTARRAALARALKREIREERYTVNRSAELIKRYAGALDTRDLARLQLVVHHLGLALEALHAE